MTRGKSISGFSKLSKRGKLKWIVENFFIDPEKVMKELTSYWLHDEEKQKVLDRFSENTISNFHLPYGVAPNFIINGKTYCIPMVTEESSVVAAAAKSAKYWFSRGGFNAEVISTEKIGQIHFLWPGDIEIIEAQLEDLRNRMLYEARSLTQNMEQRGGGVGDFTLVDFSKEVENTYQLRISFETADSMGANFINSVLECFSKTFINIVREQEVFGGDRHKIEVLMAILSNYSPACLARASVACPIEKLGSYGNYSARQLAERFEKAVNIARVDPYRATTHNKGIFNGIDAVVLATANDFRAVEANGHAYAARSGTYRGLTQCSVSDDEFKFWIELPLSVGTIGGLTSLHPLARHSLELLGNPSAEELMQIIASMGLAQNFAAIKSLITTGIQQGHMQMHLVNILSHLQASEKEIKAALQHFTDQTVSQAAVRDFLQILRKPIGDHSQT